MDTGENLNRLDFQLSTRMIFGAGSIGAVAMAVRLAVTVVAQQVVAGLASVAQSPIVAR